MKTILDSNKLNFFVNLKIALNFLISNLLSSRDFLKKSITTFGISILIIGIQAQTITGISASGAVVVSSGSSYAITWTSTAGSNANYKSIDISFTGIGGNDQVWFKDTSSQTTWELQYGSVNSNAWKDFCPSGSAMAWKPNNNLTQGSGTATVYIRNSNTQTGVYSNLITFGFGTSCNSITTAITIQATVNIVSSNSNIYTWSEPTSGTDSSYKIAGNWTPTRSTPSSNDVLVVDLAQGSNRNTTIYMDGVSESIDQFIIYPYNNVTFKCSTSTNSANWTVGKTSSTSGDDFRLDTLAGMRIDGGTINLNIPADNTAALRSKLDILTGTLNINGPGSITHTADINVAGGNLNYKSTSSSNVAFAGKNTKLLGTGGTLFIDSTVDIIIGNGTTSNFTLERPLPVISKLTLLPNTTLVSNTTSATGAQWWAYEPYLQLKWFNKQGSNAHGQIAEIPSTSSITGDMLFELLNSTRRSYRAYGLPIKNGFNLSQFTDDIVLTGTVNDAANKDSFNQTCTYCKSSVFKWDEGTQTFSALSSGATANKINLGEGILVFYRGTINNGLGDTSVAANTQIIDFVGAPHQGNFSLSLLQGSGPSSSLQGLNLVGNPYPCTIDLRLLYENNRQDIYPKFYFYDAIAKTFNTWDSSSTGNPTRNGSSTFKGGGNNSVEERRAKKLSAGASVFVFSKANNASLDFTESMKDGSLKALNRHFQGPAEESTQNCNELSIYMNYNNDTSVEADGTTLLYDMDDMFVTNDADPLDAVKMYAGFLGVGTVTNDGSWLCIDRRKKLANPGESYVVPLKVSYPKETPTDVRLYFGSCDNGSTAYDIHLVDKVNNTTVTIDNNAEYLFSIGTATEKKSDRFEIVFTGKELTNKACGIENSVSVYPNPTQDKLNILLNKNLNISSIELVDISGNVSKTFKSEFETGLNTIDINSVSNGIYYLRINTEKGIITKKIIKN